MVAREGMPYAIIEYVNKCFHDDFLFSCHKIKTRDGRLWYDVEVSKDDITHQMRFDEKGLLKSEDYSLDYLSDRHDETLHYEGLHLDDHLG